MTYGVAYADWKSHKVETVLDLKWRIIATIVPVGANKNLKLIFIRLAMMQKRKEERDLEESWKFPLIWFFSVSWSSGQSPFSFSLSPLPLQPFKGEPISVWPVFMSAYLIIGTSLHLWRSVGLNWTFQLVAQLLFKYLTNFILNLLVNDRLNIMWYFQLNLVQFMMIIINRKLII